MRTGVHPLSSAMYKPPPSVCPSVGDWLFQQHCTPPVVSWHGYMEYSQAKVLASAECRFENKTSPVVTHGLPRLDMNLVTIPENQKKYVL